MITQDGWFSWAERMPGPATKIWPEQNAIDGVVFHSAVGSLQSVIDVVMGPVSNQRSVTGVIGYDGRFIQFYPVTQSPWANGSHSANIKYNGYEHEGGRDIPSEVHERLTEEQIQADVRILQDLSVWKGVDVGYWVRPTTLVEHNQLFATACPSGRIPWDEIVRRLQEPIVPPTFEEQLDVLVAMQRQVLDYHFTGNYQQLTSKQLSDIQWLVSNEVPIAGGAFKTSQVDIMDDGSAKIT